MAQNWFNSPSIHPGRSLDIVRIVVALVLSVHSINRIIVGDVPGFGEFLDSKGFPLGVGLDQVEQLAASLARIFHTPCRIRPEPLDIAFAQDLGYRIKLVGLARPTEHGLEQRVHPCMVPLSAPLAHVENVFNAVMVEGDFVGRLTLEGRGAGADPTASAVVADLLDIAAGRGAPGFGVPASSLKSRPSAPMARRSGAYYVRLMVVDRPGVIADITAAFRDEAVSMEQFLQRGRSPGEAVPVVLTTHDTVEASMVRALGRIGGLDTVVEPPCMIRVENL